MHWLSESGEHLIQQSSKESNTYIASIDTLIVGSGYGGAVAALRFSEAGIPVYVLERGEEYVAGEFPNDVSQLGKHIRAETLSTHGVNAAGYESALFDIKLGAGIGALVGNGLGGGSLINAGVGLRPDQRVFEQESWPAALRQENLDPYYQKAQESLELQVAGSPKANHQQPNDPTHTHKYRTIHDIGLQSQIAATDDPTLEVKFQAVPIAVQLDDNPDQSLGKREVCVGCGDCVTGCNHDAKLNLTKTYLPRAKQHGAKIYTGLTVMHVLPNTSKDKSEYPWIVTYVRTSERKMQHAVLKTKHSQKISGTDEDDWTYQIKAKRVVLSAGTFGTTEIMLRSRAKGLKVSNSALGVNVSGNGDDVSFAFDMAKTTNAVGWGAKQSDEYIGPTITGGVFINDKADHRRSTLIEDGGVPGLIHRLFGELTKTLGVFAQLDHLSFRSSAGKDGLAVDPAAVNRSMPMLGMGHDSASGVIILDPISDRVSIVWTNKERELSTTLHNLRQSIIEKLGGMFIQNPATSIIPDSITSVLSGPKLNGGLFTVHPLGGCRMADNVFTGVVNHWGAVFKQDNESVNHLHDGLFIMDGSVLPSSLGVNPMMTIAALAERACEKILLAISKQQAPSVPLPPYPSVVFYQDKGSASTTRLSEVLRAEDAILDPSFKQALGISTDQTTYPVALFVEMQIDDWDQLLLSEDHEVEVIPTKKANGRFSRSRLVIDQQQKDGSVSTLELPVEQGTVKLFSEKKHSFPPVIRFLQIACTYAFTRWIPDSIKSKNDPDKHNQKQSLCKLVCDGAKLILHCLEQREFVYAITVTHQGKPYLLKGNKLLTPEATGSALFSTFKTFITTGKIPALNRRSVWEQLTQIDISLHDQSNKKVLNTRLTMDFPEMFRRFNPQLGAGRDTFTGLSEFSAYPLMMLRGILKTRLLDFRLPDYKKNLPFTDPATISKPEGYFELEHLDAECEFPTLNTALGEVKPDIHGPIFVNYDFESQEKLKIGLVRYKQPSIAVQSSATSNKIKKAKTILFLNGLALSTHAFVAQELGVKGSNSLAAKYYSEGWDVWLMEYRASPLLDASTKYSSIDAIASFDMPACVDYVIKVVSQELGIEFNQTQIFCFSHCIGSATLSMSLLGSKLKHKDGNSKLAGCLFSQFQTFLVGSKTTQMRLQLAAFLRNVTGLDFINFTAGQAKADGLHSLFDRFFSSMNYGEDNAFQNERCPHEDHLNEHQADSTSCKRMTGIFGRSIVHKNLNPETHDKLDRYFGRANIGVFLHGAKCVEYERLVDQNGQNVYLSDESIQQNIDMPIMLIHGSENVLFNSESYWQSIKNFQRVFGKYRNDQHLDQFLLANGYAHFDCTTGEHAHRDIFRHTLNFFENAFHHSLKVQENTTYVYQPRLPITGPVIGWVRHTGDLTTVRIWVEVDNTRTGLQDDNIVLTRTSYQNEVIIQTWPLQHKCLESSNNALSMISYAIADIEIPVNNIDSTIIEAICLSRVLSDGVTADPYHGRLKDLWKTGLTYTPVNNPDSPESFNALNQLFEEAKAYTDPSANLANRANPGTLSRKKREIRTEDFYTARLSQSQLIDKQEHLKFVAAACRHPGFSGLESDRSDHTLFQLSQTVKSATSKPAFMLMLGDQIYSDARAGVLDQSTIIEKLVPRYREAFGSAGFRSLATIMPLLMVIDDHEIRDNWSRESIASNEDVSQFNNAIACYDAYQHSHGPDTHATNSFDYTFNKGGYEFLVLDTRTNRSRAPTRKILDEDQWTLLSNWLDKVKVSKAPKFIVTGSVVVPGLIEDDSTPSPRQADSWQLSEADRQRLFEMIQEKEVNNIIFISSDYHCAAYSQITYPAKPYLHSYAIVAPPLHAPMRFANAEAKTVLEEERILCSKGSDVRVTTVAFDGDGWVDIDLKQTSYTMTSIKLHFHLKEIDSIHFASREVIWLLNLH